MLSPARICPIYTYVLSNERRLLSIIFIVIASIPFFAQSEETSVVTKQFTNPIAVGQDPCVVRDGNRFLWCQSDNFKISMHVSDSLSQLGEKHIIWTPPPGTMYSQEIWAPELIQIRGRWYIYFAASNGQNEHHRTYVLSAKTSDPLGEYEFHGPLYTGDEFETKANNFWAIDMTVLEQGDKLFALFSAWTTIDSDVQNLYIAPMKSPTETSGNRVLISKSDDYLWERVEEKLDTRGLNEGPQILQHEGRTFVVYSCSASWLPSYKLGLLECVGDNPLNPTSWKKFSEPVFKSTESTYGVGHGSFIQLPASSQADGKVRWWHAYHAKNSREGGWDRSLFVQPMSWNPDGTPNFGRPAKRGAVLTFP